MELNDMNAPVNHPLIMLDPDVLRSFVAIAETGSFTAAAARIYRTPSAVSMQIKRLEEQLGVSVFLRDARNVALTQEGEVLLGYARRLIALNRETISQVRDLRRVRGGADRLAVRLWRGGAAGCAQAVCQVAPIGGGRCGDRSIVQPPQAFWIGTSRHRPCQLHAASGRPAGEVVMTDDIVWAGAKGGQACLMDPLPVSMWDEGCVWRESALSALDKVGRSYRVAFMTSHMAGQRAAILADLAIAPMGRHFVGPDIQILDENCGLPAPGQYQLLLKVGADPSPQVSALSDHFRAGFERFNETGSFDT
jgi:DNA-binding transcriptional LysR family regulator